MLRLALLFQSPFYTIRPHDYVTVTIMLYSLLSSNFSPFSTHYCHISGAPDAVVVK